MIPSRDLPPVHPFDLIKLFSALTTIRSHYFAPVTIDLRQPLELEEASAESSESTREYEEQLQEAERDDFEMRFLRGWCERLVQAGLKQLTQTTRTGEPDREREVEALLDEASTLVSRLDDDSEETTYVLPAPSATSPLSIPASRSRIPVPVTIRNHTLVSSTTGHRTWGSAPILARRMALNPERFFSPNSPHLELSRRLEVLELGSGTGLVGLTAVSILSSIDYPGTVVTLSDGGEASVDSVSTRGVLDNLRRNVEHHLSQFQPDQTQIETKVANLSWGDFLIRHEEACEGGGGRGARRLPQESRYDVILGADLVYEAQQARSLWAAVQGTLRFPRPCPSRSSLTTGTTLTDDSSTPSIRDQLQDNPAFHLVIPLRPTHTQESISVDTLFPLAQTLALTPPQHTVTHDIPIAEKEAFVADEKGQCWKLVTRERLDFSGPDGFGTRGKPDKTIRYRYYRIEWEPIASMSKGSR